MLVGKGKQLSGRYLTGVKEVFPGAAILPTPKGKFRGEDYVHYLNLVANNVKGGATAETPIVVVYDWAPSHVTEMVIDHARKLHLRLIALPPNSTAALQPLDKNIFNLLHASVDDFEFAYQRDNGSAPPPTKKFALWCAAVAKTITPPVVQSGFQATGLYPCDTTKITRPDGSRVTEPAGSGTGAEPLATALSRRYIQVGDRPATEEELLAITSSVEATTHLAAALNSDPAIGPHLPTPAAAPDASLLTWGSVPGGRAKAVSDLAKKQREAERGPPPAIPLPPTRNLEKWMQQDAGYLTSEIAEKQRKVWLVTSILDAIVTKAIKAAEKKEKMLAREAVRKEKQLATEAAREAARVAREKAREEKAAAKEAEKRKKPEAKAAATAAKEAEKAAEKAAKAAKRAASQAQAKRSRAAQPPRPVIQATAASMATLRRELSPAEFAEVVASAGTSRAQRSAKRQQV